ncbi:MAG: hypothetical protein HOB18_08175 [Nitrospina sp.]|jgi:hypothetical protein|nr:hypothetical protein [Nitrospina sp.]MBT5632853.1 hypothetical protein [Nitrospina sp.]MBT6717596.1 hypothetical protein [Nitrospina sp.]
MTIQQEKRIEKLEKRSPTNGLPWIRLIKHKGETKEELFKASGYSGDLEDYNVFVVEIIDPPPRNDAEFKPQFSSSTGPVESFNKSKQGVIA